MNKQFVIWLVLWLIALPLALVIEFGLHTANNSTGEGAVNIAAFCCLTWAFIGWIPVLIVGIGQSRKKKHS